MIILIIVVAFTIIDPFQPKDEIVDNKVFKDCKGNLGASLVIVYFIHLLQLIVALLIGVYSYFKMKQNALKQVSDSKRLLFTINNILLIYICAGAILQFVEMHYVTRYTVFMFAELLQIFFIVAIFYAFKVYQFFSKKVNVLHN